MALLLSAVTELLKCFLQNIFYRTHTAGSHKATSSAVTELLKCFLQNIFYSTHLLAAIKLLQRHIQHSTQLCWKNLTPKSTGKTAYVYDIGWSPTDLTGPEFSGLQHCFSPFVYHFSPLWDHLTCSKTAQIQHKVIY